MEYDEWEENLKMGRIRKWFSLDEAKHELEKHKPVQGTYLNLLKKQHHDSNLTSNDLILSKSILPLSSTTSSKSYKISSKSSAVKTK